MSLDPEFVDRSLKDLDNLRRHWRQFDRRLKDITSYGAIAGHEDLAAYVDYRLFSSEKEQIVKVAGSVVMCLGWLTGKDVDKSDNAEVFLAWKFRHAFYYLVTGHVTMMAHVTEILRKDDGKIIAPECRTQVIEDWIAFCQACQSPNANSDAGFERLLNNGIAA